MKKHYGFTETLKITEIEGEYWHIVNDEGRKARKALKIGSGGPFGNNSR